MSEISSSEVDLDECYEEFVNLTSPLHEYCINRTLKKKVRPLLPIGVKVLNHRKPISPKPNTNGKIKRKREVIVTKAFSEQGEDSNNVSNSRTHIIPLNPRSILSDKSEEETLSSQAELTRPKAAKKFTTAEFVQDQCNIQRNSPRKPVDNNYKRIKKIKAAMNKENPNDPNYWEWVKQYQAHRQKLKAIDADPTIHYTNAKIPVACIYNPAQDHGNMEKALTIDLENIRILQKIRWLYEHTNEPEFMEFQQKLFEDNMHENYNYKSSTMANIAFQNFKLWKNLNNARSYIDSRDELTKWYKRQKEIILNMTKYPIFNEARLCAPFEELAIFKAKDKPRPIVYLDYDVSNSYVTRIFVELYADICPMTAENFRCLCTGERGRRYNCTELEVLFPKTLYVGGFGVTSIYGGAFPNENYKVKHDRPGIISMLNFGPNTQSNNSEFQIAVKPFPELDGKYCAFGRVIEGLKGLQKVANYTKPDEHTGVPAVHIYCNNCGETTLGQMHYLLPPSTLLRKEVYMDDALIASEPRARVMVDARSHSNADSDKISSGSSVGLGGVNDDFRYEKKKKKKRHKITRPKRNKNKKRDNSEGEDDELADDELNDEQIELQSKVVEIWQDLTEESRERKKELELRKRERHKHKHHRKKFDSTGEKQTEQNKDYYSTDERQSEEFEEN